MPYNSGGQTVGARLLTLDLFLSRLWTLKMEPGGKMMSKFVIAVFFGWSNVFLQFCSHRHVQFVMLFFEGVPSKTLKSYTVYFYTYSIKTYIVFIDRWIPKSKVMLFDSHVATWMRYMEMVLWFNPKGRNKFMWATRFIIGILIMVY